MSKEIPTPLTDTINKPSDQQQQQQTTAPTSSSGEKMLIEKDGTFELMSVEEYTAYEKKLEIERKTKSIEKQKTAQNGGGKSNPGALKMPPRPPQRPKTTSDNRNVALKNRYLSSANESMNNNNNNQNTSNSSEHRIRVSYSADFTRKTKDRSKR